MGSNSRAKAGAEAEPAVALRRAGAARPRPGPRGIPGGCEPLSGPRDNLHGFERLLPQKWFKPRPESGLDWLFVLSSLDSGLFDVLEPRVLILALEGIQSRRVFTKKS